MNSFAPGMVIKVGINGFGRIGRVIFRTCHQNENIELSAINDPAIDAEYICYLIKFDSTHGKFNGIVTRCDDEIKVDGHHIKIFHEKLPLNIPWREAGVEYVIESSGMFTTLEKASGHLQSDTVRRVIVTAPSIDVPMIILGVNDNRLSLDHKVMSCASSTLYCLAPIIKVLEDNFGVEEGFMTSIHAMTPSLKPLDGLCLKGKHWRDHRSIHQNIIPASTGACKALGKILPDVKDKISGLAFRIPIVNVSVLDLSIRLTTNTTLEDIVDCIITASNTDMKNIIKISNEESVSSDFIGDNHSCILDVNSSLQLNPNFFKLICWYENEHSYACRVVDSIFFSERQLCVIRLTPEIRNINTVPNSKINEVKQTVSRNKEFIIASSFNTENKLINLTSRNNTLDIKIPPTSHNSGTASSYLNTPESIEKNETNKTPKPIVRQKRASFFYSCVSLPQQNFGSNDCIKAQERLQNVKQEFSKMVNITEDLLKKSHRNKALLNTVTNDSKDIEISHVKSNIEKENILTENNIENHNKPIFNICGDRENKIEVLTEEAIPVYSKEEIKSNNKFYTQFENVANIKWTPIQWNAEARSRHSMIEDISIIKNIDHKADFKNEVAKAINTLIDGLTENFQIQAALHEQGDTPNNILNIDSKEIIKDNEIDDAAMANKARNFGDNTSSVDLLNLNNKNTFKDDLENANNEMKESVIDKYSKYRNKLGINYAKYEPNQEESIKLYRITKDEHLSKTDDHSKDMMLSKKILERLNKSILEPIFIVPEDKITDDTTLSVNNFYVKQNKLDIYDKLDSASASGSENSFEIHGRKSHIIDITDLTNSIEDLANLEKICKIIEISDELSDKLFSTLKKKDCQEIKKKTWSFKDLCERIKLDEFCNEVFGKTV